MEFEDIFLEIEIINIITTCILGLKKIDEQETKKSFKINETEMTVINTKTSNDEYKKLILNFLEQIPDINLLKEKLKEHI